MKARCLGWVVLLILVTVGFALADDEEPAGRTSEMEATAVATATSAALAAPTSQVRWADEVVHTNPVLPRGLGPEKVTFGYEIVPLSDIGRGGEKISAYTSWMTGRSGEKVWVKFRPGEAVEATRTGTQTIERVDGKWIVETWHAKRIVRCGNPTSIDFYIWKEVRVETVPGPERIVERTVEKPVWYLVNTQTKVVQTKGFAFYQSSPQVVGLPEVKYMFFWEEGLKHDIIRAAGQALSASRFSITQNAPVNNRASSGSDSSSSAASSSSSSSSASASANQQQEQQQGTTISGGGDPSAN